MFVLFHVSWITTIFVAFARVIATIAFFTFLDDFVAAERPVVFLKAILLAFVVEDGVQHLRYVVN